MAYRVKATGAVRRGKIESLPGSRWMSKAVACRDLKGCFPAHSFGSEYHLPCVCLLPSHTKVFRSDRTWEIRHVFSSHSGQTSQYQLPQKIILQHSLVHRFIFFPKALTPPVWQNKMCLFHGRRSNSPGEITCMILTPNHEIGSLPTRRVNFSDRKRATPLLPKTNTAYRPIADSIDRSQR